MPDEQAPDINPKQNPIIQLRSPVSGYLAYLIPGVGTGSMIIGIRVVRLTRTLNSSNWVASAAFTGSAQINGTVEGALNRTWRDRIPVSFDIGEDGTHLYLTFRRQVVSNGVLKSIIRVADCVDVPAGTCTVVNGMLSAAWRVRDFAPDASGGDQYQPGITASKLPGDQTVALTYYQQIFSNPSQIQIEIIGRYSRNGGTDWTIAQDIHPGLSWVPCPTASATPGHPGYFGDYVGSTILPRPYTILDLPWIVTGYASSVFGCQDLNELTFDQHVHSVVW